MGALTIQCGTKFLPVLILQILRFFQQSAKISSCKQNKNYRKHFPLKIYSNLNSLHKNTVLTEIVSVIMPPCAFRNKAVYNELLVLLRVPPVENIINVGFWTLSENRKS